MKLATLLFLASFAAVFPFHVVPPHEAGVTELRIPGRIGPGRMPVPARIVRAAEPAALAPTTKPVSRRPVATPVRRGGGSQTRRAAPNAGPMLF